MSKDDFLQFEGIVISARGNGNFLVQIDDAPSSAPINCHLSGKIRKNAIKILEGDRVKIEVSSYDLLKGRITYRSRAESQ